MEDLLKVVKFALEKAENDTPITLKRLETLLEVASTRRNARLEAKAAREEWVHNEAMKATFDY
jgi:hypothetical protein